MRSARAEFSKATKEEGWLRCFDAKIDDGRCELKTCGMPFAGRRPEYHHVVPAAIGGDNSLGNLLVVCPPCHRFLTKMETRPMVDRTKSIYEKRAGLRRSKYRWGKSGTVERRSG